MDKSKDELIEELKKYSKERIEEIISDLSEIHEKEKISVPNIINNTKVCFILSCPGREEMIYGKPCQGITGENLNMLLVHLNGKYSTLFPSEKKEDYDILNATQIVHFDALDGRSEGSADEIKAEKENIKTYLNNNQELKLVIILGKKAKLHNKLFKNKSIVTTHLGFRSVNKIKKDSDGNDIMEYYSTSCDRRKARIKVIAEEISMQIEDLIKVGKLNLE